MQRPRVSVFQICIHSFSYLLITLSAGHPLAAHGTDVINSYLITKFLFTIRSAKSLIGSLETDTRELNRLKLADLFSYLRDNVGKHLHHTTTP